MLPPRQPRFRHPLFTIQRLARKLRKDCKKSFNPTQVRPTLYKNPSDKPVLSYYPPIWAQSRQEVCESLEWFRSFQGGVYFSNNIAKGYLLSAFPSQRDAFYHNGKLIISHGGGKAESLSYTREGQPKLCAAEDQNAQDNSVRALLTNYNRQIPLVLLIDDRYPRFPFDLSKKGIAYTVLGLYIITHVWQEYEEKTSTQRGRVVRFKFAFQWCDDQGIPWWWKKPENKAPNSEAHGSHKPCPPFRRSMPVKKKETKLSEIHPPDRLADSSSCLACSKSSPQVFSVGWACLHSSCPQFWILPTGAELPSSLEYHEPFLKLRSTISLDDELKDIRPLLPLTNPSNKVTTVHTFSKGWHCNICGRLSCRFKFEHWECAHCGNSLPVHGRTRTALELRVIDTSISFSGYKLKDSKIKQTHDQPFVNDRDGGHCMTFILPENKGYIHRIRPKNIKLREADEIFELYQEEASNGELPFRRFPLTTHKCNHTFAVPRPKILTGFQYEALY
ncbi:hypothetical protein VKT23_000715 [Stygiomarasmius scandens]|uniref:Uncharacterized protein n=1 Tax=Marasmiellus scandens TaxID=2682957 RepID=A0ABR1K5X7_9AGAR